MLLHPEYAPDTSLDRLAWWRILNEASQAMKAAKTPEAVALIVAKSLRALGFLVVVGNLNRGRTEFSVLSGQQSSAVDIPSFPLSTLNLSEDFVQANRPELLSLDEQILEALLKAGQQRASSVISQKTASSSEEERSIIVAPIFNQPRDIKDYLIFAIADSVSANELSMVAAFCNVAATELENQILRQEVESQQKNAKSLREVSKIVSSVSSNLNPDTILISILEELAKVIPYDSSAVLLERSGYLKLEAGRGFEHLEKVVGIVVQAEENPLYQEMKRTHMPIVINNVRKDPRYTLWAGTNPIRSWVGVPLILRNEIIGQISIDSFQEDAFREEDGILAFAFAQHVATAIQNARLFDEISRTAEELQALLDGARDVSSSLRTERIIYLMANRLKELMNASVIVYLLDKEDRLREPVVFLEMQLDQLSQGAIKLIKLAAQQAIESKQGITAAPPYQTDTDISGERLPATIMAAPFIVKDRALGAIIVVREDALLFTQSGLDLLTRFALQAGIAIDNSRLYEQISRRLERENLINKLSRQMSSKLSLTRLANILMQTAQQVAQADIAGLILIDPLQEDMYLRYKRDVGGLNLLKQSASIPGLAQLVMEQQQVILTDIYDQESYGNQKWVQQPVQGAIAVPITTGDRVLGALGVFKEAGPFIYSNEILNTLEYIGWQAGVAIENALLFQQVNEYAHMLEDRVRERTAEIQKQQEQTAAILECAADAICITTADGKIEYVNPAFTGLTGYEAEEVNGEAFSSLISQETGRLKVEQMWNTMLAGKTWRGDVRNKRKDESRYDADLTIAPILDSEGQVDKFVTIQRDISKKTELDRLKTEFLVTASHELRTPLTTVTGYAELLLNRQFSKSETEHFLRYIYEQSKHLSNLVSDLLDVSRLEAGAAFALSPQLLDPVLLVKQVVEQWQGPSSKHDITLIEPGHVPGINVDPDRLKQILDNLLSNAVKYSPDGGSITVTLKKNITNLLVSVQDWGIGMTQDEQQYLFEKFWRADASRVAIEGTGLGMVIVKHLIELHGGKIWVTSQKGKGTTVHFTLPLLNGASAILIIEDDPHILELQEKLLTSAGYHVMTSSSGRKGLEMALTEYPDLIILDLMLPELDGEEVLHKLKNTPTTQNIPVVVVSAKSALFNIEYAFTLGAADFMTKPFDFDEYLGRIKIALLNKQA
jgi:PAS domain S-box-containing protein